MLLILKKCSVNFVEVRDKDPGLDGQNFRVRPDRTNNAETTRMCNLYIPIPIPSPKPKSILFTGGSMLIRTGRDLSSLLVPFWNPEPEKRLRRGRRQPYSRHPAKLRRGQLQRPTERHLRRHLTWRISC
jgi:hypothetical protein